MSSELIQKRWGSEEFLQEDPLGNYDTKRIVLLSGQCTSLHVHQEKREWLYLIEGVLELKIDADESRVEVLYPGQHIFLPPKIPHRMTSLNGLQCVYLEVSQCGCREDAERVKL